MCSYVEFCELVKNHMVILSVFKFQDFGFFFIEEKLRYVKKYYYEQEHTFKC